MTIYRVSITEEIEDEPIIVTNVGLFNKDGIDESTESSQILPCVNYSFNIDEGYIEEMLLLFDFINSGFIDYELTKNFIEIERTENRVEDLKIKQCSVRGVVNVLEYNRVG